MIRTNREKRWMKVEEDIGNINKRKAAEWMMEAETRTVLSID